MYVNGMTTDDIPQVDKIREYFLKGVAATFPTSTWPHILRWMVVQKLAFHPNVNLGILDDLIAMRLVYREIVQSRCKCSSLEVYKLTDKGNEYLKSL